MYENKKTFLWMSAILVLLFCAGYSQQRLSALNKSYQLTEPVDLDNADPVVEFTAGALGGFRGVVADILYMRIQQLQDEERFYEIPQLSSWIVALQPQLTKSTSFIANDMAWNISDLYSEPAVSWEWINRGIYLLRNEALRHRPEEAGFCEDLSDIYFLRIMGINDNKSKDFKASFCNEYKLLFGATLRQRETVVSRLTDAPKSLRELQDALKGKSLGRVAAAAGLTVEKLILDFKANGALSKLLRRALDEKEIPVVDAYLRRQWVEGEYQMDVELMAFIERTYGAVDWAMPNATALYWSVRGLQLAQDKGLDKSITFFEFRVCSILLHAFQNGILLHAFDASSYQSAPNLKLGAAVERVTRELIGKYSKDNGEYKRIYLRFLENAVATYYSLGDHEKVAKYLTILDKEFPLAEGRNPRTFPGFLLNLEMKSMDYRAVQSKVSALITQAFWKYQEGDVEAASKVERVAELYHRAYQYRVRNESKVAKLPDIETMKRSVATEIYAVLSRKRKKIEKNQ